MIESVSTLPAQTSALRVTSQSAPASAAVTQQSYPSLVSLRVRVDNDLNKAILEVRSNDTGEVVAQYPSAAQIRAFQRAAELQRAEAQQSQDARAIETAQSTKTQANRQAAAQQSTGQSLGQQSGSDTSSRQQGTPQPTQTAQTTVSVPNFTQPTASFTPGSGGSTASRSPSPAPQQSSDSAPSSDASGSVDVQT